MNPNILYLSCFFKKCYHFNMKPKHKKKWKKKYMTALLLL